MPLESLSQPFNPDEPGRKIREVQEVFAENREEARTAKEQWERLRDPLVSPFIDQVSGSWFEDDIHQIKIAEEGNVSRRMDVVQSKIDGKYFFSTVQDVIMNRAESGVSSHLEYALMVPPWSVENLRERWSPHVSELEFQYFGTKARGLTYSFISLQALYGKVYPEHARAAFEEFKNDPAHFDKQKELWTSTFYIPEKAGMPHTPAIPANNFTETQLAAVVVQQNFDMHGAKEEYERLKKTALFDPEAGWWWNGIDEDGKVYPVHALKVQLLDILIQDAFEKAGIIDLTPEAMTQLPEERNF